MLTSELTRVADAPAWPGSGSGIISANEPLTLQMSELAVARVESSLRELKAYAGR